MRAKRGPKHLETKVVQKIRALYDTDEFTQKELASKFGLSQSTICKIVNKYIHKNVPMINIPMISIGGTAEVKVGYRHGD